MNSRFKLKIPFRCKPGISGHCRRSAAVSAAARSIIQKPVEFRALIWQSGLLRVGHPLSGLRNKNGAGFWPAPLSPAPPERVLHVVIKVEFVRMRTQADGVVFLALGADPHFDEVFGEDVALEQKRVILLQAIKGSAR